MTKRKAGPPDPPSGKSRPETTRTAGVPCPAIALPEGHGTLGKLWYRSHEQANLRRDPPGLVHLRTWASHPIMSRRANRAAALIPRCRPEPDD
jgi:hypothetical protein